MIDRELEWMLEEFKRDWYDKRLYNYTVPYCPFDHGGHQFYNYDPETNTRLEDLDHCKKCGKKA